MAKFDTDDLRAALIGYQHEYDHLTGKIAEIRAQIRGRSNAATNAPVERTRRGMSAAARKRIAAGQKERWAKYHAEHGAPKRKSAKSSGKRKRKRKLSAEGRANIIAALKKRWAATKST